MNTYYFIAQRLRKGKTSRFSAVVMKIAVASVALGLALVLISFHILMGFEKEVKGNLFSFWGHLRVTQFNNNESFEEAPISLKTNLFENYSQIPLLSNLYPFAQKAGILKANEEVAGVIMKGITAPYAKAPFIAKLSEGRFIQFPKEGYSKEILISKKLANTLAIQLNDTIPMFFIQDPPRARKLVVVGMYQTWMPEFDSQFIVGDLGLIQRLNNWEDTLAGGYEIFVRDIEQLDPSEKEVYEMMDYNMQIEKVSNHFLSFFEWLGLISNNLYVFLFLILSVACFNMVSVLLIMIMERTQMIGTLKALGATNWQIQKIFWYQGILLVGRGMLLGNVLGLGISFLQYQFHWIPLDPENYFMETVPVAWNWEVVFWLNLLTIVLIACVLFIPVLIVSRFKPIKAIRFD